MHVNIKIQSLCSLLGIGMHPLARIGCDMLGERKYPKIGQSGQQQ